MVTVSWSWLQDTFGVLPEGYDFKSGAVTYKSNSLRPDLTDVTTTPKLQKDHCPG